MEKIQLFVDNMFLSLPDTPEVRQAKAHILEGMADRYEALLAQGKNQDEAFGAVIGEFGSVEELRQELGLPSGSGKALSPLPSPSPGRSTRSFAGGSLWPSPAGWSSASCRWEFGWAWPSCPGQGPGGFTT